MADQDKPQDKTQTPTPAQELDTTKSEEKPTTTESAPAPEPATEPIATTAPPEPAPEQVAAPTATPAPETTDKPAAEPTPAPEPEQAPAPASAPTAETTTATPAPETTDKPAAEPTPAPTAETTTAAPEEKTETTNEPPKPEYFSKTPALEQFFDHLPAILTNTGHNEMWGVPLKHDAGDIPTINVLIKFLRANAGDLKLAEDQLTKALEWRKEIQPLALIDPARSYDATKFGGLGYLTTYAREGKSDLVVTWNIYGAVKDVDATFGDVDEFVKWRAALMELAVQELKMDKATSVIDYDGEDPYQMIQVHDYLNVSFFRLNPSIRAATKKTIEVFSTAYPELLREKYFVNVPAIMGWMFALVKMFVNENTTRKFHPISNGANLAREFPGLVENFPNAYGGGAPELEGSARTVSLNKE